MKERKKIDEITLPCQLIHLFHLEESERIHFVFLICLWQVRENKSTNAVVFLHLPYKSTELSILSENFESRDDRSGSYDYNLIT